MMDIIEFNPEKEEIKLDETFNYDIDKEFINYSGFDFYDKEDSEMLEGILCGDLKKDVEKENKKLIKKYEECNKAIIPKKPKINKIPSFKLKYDDDIFSDKLITFFLESYNIISKKYYDKIIEDEDEEENTNEINHLHKLIDQIILEHKENNCKINIIYRNKEKKSNQFNFILHLYVVHEISKFHGLLNLEITFKVKMEMSIRSGNVKITFSKCTINYENKKQEIIMRPEFTCLLINNKLGNYSITYCNCNSDKCVKCKNRMSEPKPFDDVLYYLRKKNKINDKIEFTDLWFGKYNKYRNDAGYNCSFCREFYQKKLNIVKLFCNPDFDQDHTCQFWICRDCYFYKSKKKYNEICPNCGKFYVNFSRLGNIFRYLKWKKDKDNQ